MLLRAIFLSAAIGLGCAPALACTAPGNSKAMASEMISWINAQRRAKGLSTLSMDSKLAAAAQGHACDMATRGYFGHQRAGGPDLARRLRSNGYAYRAAAENIAKMGSADVSRAARIWRESPPHWANILNRKVNEIGLGIAVGGDRVYWVMNVGREK